MFLKYLLNKKIKKLTVFYSLINKRTQCSILFLNTLVHTFKTIKFHLNQQLRIKGIFSNKILYVILNDVKYIKKYFPTLISINFLHIKLLIDNDYIIFLI